MQADELGRRARPTDRRTYEPRSPGARPRGVPANATANVTKAASGKPGGLRGTLNFQRSTGDITLVSIWPEPRAARRDRRELPHGPRSRVRVRPVRPAEPRLRRANLEPRKDRGHEHSPSRSRESRRRSGFGKTRGTWRFSRGTTRRRGPKVSRLCAMKPSQSRKLGRIKYDFRTFLFELLRRRSSPGSSCTLHCRGSRRRAGRRPRRRWRRLWRARSALCRSRAPGGPR